MLSGFSFRVVVVDKGGGADAGGVYAGGVGVGFWAQGDVIMGG